LSRNWRSVRENKFDEIITFRALREDKKELVDLARTWQLEESEIARRALRTGLKEIRSQKIFGTRELCKDLA